MAEERPGIAVKSSGVDGVWELLLDRPPVNAFSAKLYAELLEALSTLAERDDLRCVIVASALEGGFCAGADTKELAALTSRQFTPVRWDDREAVSRGVLAALEQFPVPTVAAIDGYAVGFGFVLASLCDVRYATTRSWFSIPELDVARLGGAAHAMRLLPPGIVRSMYFEGSKLPAQAAASFGMLNGVVEPADLWHTVMEAAKRIARHDRYALRQAKRVLRKMEHQPLESADTIERLFSFRLAARGLRDEGGDR